MKPVKMTDNTQLRSLTISVKKYSDDPDIDRFFVLANSGMSCLVEAGQLLVKKMGEDPNFRDKILEVGKHLKEGRAFTSATLDTFKHLGLKEWHPAHVLDSDRPGNRRMLRLPYSVQEQYASGTVDVLMSNGQVMKMELYELGHEQANQVVGPYGIRTIREQKAYVEARLIKKVAKEPANTSSANSQPYSIIGNEVLFATNTRMNAKELLAILTQLQK
ncbi:MAG: hypothetical protein AB7O65_14440 [Candidatus Korobacteraceae bacterium]